MRYVLRPDRVYRDAPAEYYRHPGTGAYCLRGTTCWSHDLDKIIALFESPDLLTEIPPPDYITGDPDDDPLVW